MFYEVGELVQIKEDFAKHRFDDDPQVDPKMPKYAGSVTEITKRWSGDPPWYKVKGNDFIWDGRWLESAGTEFKPVTENELFDLFGE